MDVESASINKDLNVKVEDFPFSKIMKRIMENLTKSRIKATQGKDHVENNWNDNIVNEVHDEV